MKKLLLLLIVIFCLTGCDVNYNLVISEDSFDETITLSFLKSQNSYEDVSANLGVITPATLSSSETRYYDSDITEDSNYYNLIYKFNHDSTSISNAYFIRNCYPDLEIVNTNDKIEISTGNQFMCYYGDDGLKADSVNINITTKMNVLNNNADNVSGNTYTWTINETNYNNKPIEMQIQKPLDVQSVIEENDNSFTLIFVIVIMLLVILIVYLVIKFKTKKNNSF